MRRTESDGLNPQKTIQDFSEDSESAGDRIRRKIVYGHRTETDTPSYLLHGSHRPRFTARNARLLVVSEKRSKNLQILISFFSQNPRNPSGGEPCNGISLFSPVLGGTSGLRRVRDSVFNETASIIHITHGRRRTHVSRVGPYATRVGV